MSFDHRHDRPDSSSSGHRAEHGLAPGKRTLSGRLQRRASVGSAAVAPEAAVSEDDVASAGFAGAAVQTPFAGEIGQAFGADFSSVRAHVGPEAAAACEALGADAYTVGQDVAFATPSPDKGLVAHELTHVVQQSAIGPKVATKQSSGGSGEALEVEADVAAAQVVAGEPVTAVLSTAAPRIARKTGIGTATAQFVESLPPPHRHAPHSDPGPHVTGVHLRNKAEWIAFLRDHADTRRGMLELCAFMSAATGRSFASPDLVVHLAVAPRPNQRQAIHLMLALLEVGTNIELADTGGEHTPVGEAGGIFRAQLADMMNAFYARFTAPALQQRTMRGGGAGHLMVEEDVEDVAALAEESDDMEVGGEPSPVHALIAAALGTAFGAAGQILHAPNTAEARSAVRVYYALFENAGLTIRGALDELEASAQQRETVLMTIFNGAAGAITGPLDGAIAVLLGGLSGVASTWFGTFISGDPRGRARGLKDKFRVAIWAEGGRLGVDPTTVESVISMSDRVLNY